MKKWILISAVLHGCFTTAFVAVNRSSAGLPRYARIVPVELVMIETEPPPEAVVKTAEAPAVEVKPADQKENRPAPELAVSRDIVKTEPAEAEAAPTPGPRLTVEGEPFPYQYYLEMLRKRIQENWHPPFNAGPEGQPNAVVVFRILRNGTIEKVMLEKATGKFMLDQAARRAVDAVGKMPPLPPEFPGGYVTIHIEFETRLP